MKYRVLLSTTLVLAAMEATAATKPLAPDKEMLRMMDFLTDWELIQHMEKIRELGEAGYGVQKAPRAGTGAPAAGKKKEAAK
jgi:hypothetical protein